MVDLELDPAHQNMRSVTHGDHSLPSAEEVRVGIVPSSINKRKALLIGSLVTIVLVLVVLVPVGISRNNKSDDGITVDSSSSSRFQETITFLLDYVDHKSLSTQGSPQFRAAEWMADIDPQLLPLQRGGRFLQRYALIVFYYATQGAITWTHQLGFLTNTHECDWNYKVNDVTMGAICDDNLVVKQLVIGTYSIDRVVPYSQVFFSLTLYHLTFYNRQYWLDWNTSKRTVHVEFVGASRLATKQSLRIVTRRTSRNDDPVPLECRK